MPRKIFKLFLTAHTSARWGKPASTYVHSKQRHFTVDVPEDFSENNDGNYYNIISTNWGNFLPSTYNITIIILSSKCGKRVWLLNQLHNIKTTVFKAATN